MYATPEYRPHEKAPVEDTYVLVDRSGEVLSVAVYCHEGEVLPELAVSGSNPIGYVRIGTTIPA
jgi:hypothetical protein